MTASAQERAGGDAPGALVDALSETMFLTLGVLTRVSAEHELSLTQLRVLAILRDRRLRMTELASHLGLEKSTMTGLVARAEKRGLLERAPSAADRRALEVFLTEDGAALAEQGARDVAAALSPITGHLSALEQERLRTLLVRLLHAAR